ncbi:uncharacterized protein LOC121425604 [Lytechinus variegatus]|uniref:uncharacterized protein LOC121425604 n=1 Tax=Lytechinus variegatus TaxID=7654 RepID=UPI001BB2237E|nr:uncharacterized protein LOC121425604 [Lytechinus variegatus]
MEIMNLKSLRRTFFILFSVMGLFLVLSCFVSTEDYFAKKTRLVQSTYDRTTHNLMTASKTTRQSLTLKRTTGSRDESDGRFTSGRSTTDLAYRAVTTMKSNSLATTRKSISRNRTRDREGEIYGKGKLNTTGGQDVLRTKERFMRNPRVRPLRISSKREILPKNNLDTKDVARYHDQNFTENRQLFLRKPKLRPVQLTGNSSTKVDKIVEYSNKYRNFTESRNLTSLITSSATYPSEASAAEEYAEDNNKVLLRPVETRERPVARKNTFLSKKYKNTDLIEQFKQHFIDGNAKDAEEILEKKPWKVAKVFSGVKQRDSKDRDARRRYFEEVSKRTLRFARGFGDPDRSVLRKVHWRPHLDNHSYSYLITPHTNCLDFKGDYADVTLFVFILTSPTHYSNRKVIRRSWMAQAKREHLDMKMIFLLGATDDKVVQHYIDDEAEQNRDILQENFHDSYVNLTLKTIMGLKWSTQTCPKAKFVMKVDDDVAVNVVDLMAYLKTVNASDALIGGILTKGAAPYRNSRKKWYVPEDVYPEPTYPPYPQGKSYIMTMDVAMKLFITSTEIDIFPWEDVFIGICLQKIGVQPSEIPGFDGAGAIFSPQREIWRDDGALKILQGMLIVYDLRDSQIELISHVWRYKTWPTEH